MSKASTTARAKAIRFCGGGAPRMKREDGGGAGNGSSSGESNPEPVVMPAPPPPPPPAAKGGKDDATVGIKIDGAQPAAGPRELNAGVFRRGGRARSAAR